MIEWNIRNDLTDQTFANAIINIPNKLCYFGQSPGISNASMRAATPVSDGIEIGNVTGTAGNDYVIPITICGIA